MTRTPYLDSYSKDKETLPSHQQHDQAMKHNHARHHFRHVLERKDTMQQFNKKDSKCMKRRRKTENGNQFVNFQDESSRRNIWE